MTSIIGIILGLLAICFVLIWAVSYSFGSKDAVQVAKKGTAWFIVVLAAFIIIGLIYSYFA